MAQRGPTALRLETGGEADAAETLKRLHAPLQKHPRTHAFMF